MDRGPLLLGAGVGLAALLLLASQASAEPARPAKRPKVKPPGPPPAEAPPKATAPELPPLGRDPEAKDDQTALARMLESETDVFRERVVVGWIAAERAKRLKISLFQELTGRAGVYGRQVVGDEIRYASTRLAPTAESRALARDILAGVVRPSNEIRSRGLSPWVELRYPKKPDPALLESRAAHLLRLQTPIGKHGDFGGIWGRVTRSNWFLYSRKSPIIKVGAGDGSALAALDAVPLVSALDTESS